MILTVLLKQCAITSEEFLAADPDTLGMFLQMTPHAVSLVSKIAAMDFSGMEPLKLKERYEMLASALKGISIPPEVLTQLRTKAGITE